MNIKKKISLIVVMTLGCITQINANDNDQASCDNNHTAGKVFAPVVVPTTVSLDIVTVGTQHLTSRYIDYIRGNSDNDSDNSMTESQKPMKNKKCKAACDKQNNNSCAADRQMYREVLCENPACEKTCHRNCHNHTGHKAGMHKDDNQNS